MFQVVERKLPNIKGQREPVLKHYIPRSGTQTMNKDIQIPCHTLSETSVLFPDVPHSWLDGGKLLRLHEPKHKGNLKLFQQQWRRAQVKFHLCFFFCTVSQILCSISRQLFVQSNFITLIEKSIMMKDV